MLPTLKYPRPVRRLRVRWREGAWSIERQTLVPEMTLPRPDELPDAASRGISGIWYELTDPQGKTLYRSIIPEHRFAPAEVFHEDGSMTRPGPLPTNVLLDVLLPVVTEEEELRIFAAGDAGKPFLAADPRLAAAGGRPAEIARLPLPPLAGEGRGTEGPEGGTHGGR